MRRAKEEQRANERQNQGPSKRPQRVSRWQATLDRWHITSAYRFAKQSVLWVIGFIVALAMAALLAFIWGMRGDNYLGYLPLLVVMVLLLIRIGYRYEWTGFGELARSEAQDRQIARPRKTLWDWMTLLFVPIAIAAATVAIPWWLDNSQQAIEEQNRALQEYLSEMQTLLLDEGLQQSEADSTVRLVARARTLGVLSAQSAEGKRTLLLFLSDSGLLSRNNPIINLSRADLSEAALYGMTLTSLDLTEANFSGADLSYADLSYAKLTNAYLQEADLRGANLRAADLRDADLSDADLSYADLSDANLDGAKFDGALMPDGSQHP